MKLLKKRNINKFMKYMSKLFFIMIIIINFKTCKITENYIFFC